MFRNKPFDEETRQLNGASRGAASVYETVDVKSHLNQMELRPGISVPFQSFHWFVRRRPLQIPLSFSGPMTCPREWVHFCK
jgi:hypothetical protein